MRIDFSQSRNVKTPILAWVEIHRPEPRSGSRTKRFGPVWSWDKKKFRNSGPDQDQKFLRNPGPTETRTKYILEDPNRLGPGLNMRWSPDGGP